MQKFVFNNKIQKTIVDTALVREKNNNNKIQKQTKTKNDDCYTMLFFGGIHLIEKTLSLEKYKPWTMGPNGFMGTTLLALQI